MSVTATQLGRRGFLRGIGGLAAGAAVLSVTGCGTGTSRSSAKTVTVRSSGGAYQTANVNAVFTPFTKETGITVQVVNNHYAEMLAQIQQGRPQFDLIDDSMLDFQRFAKAGAIQKLDYDRLPHVGSGKIPAKLVTPHSVAKNYWSSVMAYRTDTFGKNPPQSWADFWDPAKFAGKRSLQDDNADMPELEFALLADGVALDQLYPLDVDRAFASLSRIRSSVLKFWDSGSEPGLLLGRNEVGISSVWNGRLDSLIASGSPLAYQWHGARRQSNGWAIPNGAKNVDAAYQLIDYSLRPDVQAQFAIGYPDGPVVPAANKLIPENKQQLLPSAPEHLDLGFDLDTGWWLANGDAMDKRWEAWSNA
jgi:putative spermidine/putrescine transport system substrate-binding protein